ncbi:hypothetical protein HGM15179_021251, partial [Zosterops borbonicus]
GFLQDVLLQGGTQSPFSRALRGLIPLTQLVEELREGCRLRAAALGTALPDAFSASRPFRDLQEQGRANERMLRAAQTLRDNGGGRRGFLGIFGNFGDGGRVEIGALGGLGMVGLK